MFIYNNVYDNKPFKINLKLLISIKQKYKMMNLAEYSTKKKLSIDI